MGTRKLSLRLVAPVVLSCVIALLPEAARAASAGYTISPVTDLTTSCAGQNAEVEQAADTSLGYVYEEWMGCSGIAFARSTDGGKSFSSPLSLPSSTGNEYNSWDPTIAVAPDGTVYAAFMRAKNDQWYPEVAVSFDHGQTFSQVTSVVPPDAKNWGDRPFLAAGPGGTVYLSWSYGPNRTSVTFLCDASGSCGYATGDVNVVLQRSTDHGKSFGPMSYISPGFPASGGDSAPLVVEPSGRIDVLYQDFPITDTSTYAMSPGVEYFTASTDGGHTWSSPSAVGAQAGTMALNEWWIDGAIGMDAAGNLYATWDTQGTNQDGTPNDTGWLSYSTNGGRRWSVPVQVPADTANAPHIMSVAGGGAGVAYISWLSSSNPLGYADYLRAFSITRGWLSPPVQISTEFGDRSIWPGDTTGISTLSPSTLVLSWGSATPSSGKKSDIFAAQVAVSIG